MSTAAVKTIRFEDHGQDFLEWDLDADGRVVACRPFQATIWCTYRVVNHALLFKGARVEIVREEDVATIKYPLAAVRKAKAQSMPTNAVLNSKVVTRGAKALLANYNRKTVSA